MIRTALSMVLAVSTLACQSAPCPPGTPNVVEEGSPDDVPTVTATSSRTLTVRRVFWEEGRLVPEEIELTPTRSRVTESIIFIVDTGEARDGPGAFFVGEDSVLNVDTDEGSFAFEAFFPGELPPAGRMVHEAQETTAFGPLPPLEELSSICR